MPLPGFMTMSLRGSSITGYHPEFNLWEHFGSPTSLPFGVVPRLILAGGFYSDSQNPGVPGFDIGNWPVDTTLDLIVLPGAILRGRAGRGGWGQDDGFVIEGAGGGGAGTYTLPGASTPNITTGGPGGGDPGDPAATKGADGTLTVGGAGGTADVPSSGPRTEESYLLLYGSHAIEVPNISGLVVNMTNGGLIEGAGGGARGAGAQVDSPAPPDGETGCLITERPGYDGKHPFHFGDSGYAVRTLGGTWNWLAGGTYPDVHGFIETGDPEGP